MYIQHSLETREALEKPTVAPPRGFRTAVSSSHAALERQLNMRVKGLGKSVKNIFLFARNYINIYV
jgi:hypothetical protein